MNSHRGGRGVPLDSHEDTNYKELYHQRRGLFENQSSAGEQVGSSSRPSPKPKAVVPIYDKESRDKEVMYSPAIKGVRACLDALANLQEECKSAERETKTHSYDRPLQQTLARYQDNDDWIINLKQMTVDHPHADGDGEDIMEQLQTSLNQTGQQSISIGKNKWTWYRKHTTEENFGKIRDFAFEQLGVIGVHLGTLVPKDPDTVSTEQDVKHESEPKDYEPSLPTKTPPTLPEKPSHLRPSSSRSESSGDVKPPRAQGAPSFKPDPPAPRHTLFRTDLVEKTDCVEKENKETQTDETCIKNDKDTQAGSGPDSQADEMSLEEELKATKMDLEARSNELDKLKKAGNSTEEELKQIKLDFEAKSKELDDEKQKYSEREEELKATKLELEARSNELDKLNNEMVNKSAEEEQTKMDLVAKPNEPDEDNAEMVQKYSELEKKFKQTKMDVEAKSKDLDDEKQKYSAVEERLKQTEDNLKTKDIELAMLRNEAAGKTGQLAHARSDEEAKSAKVNELHESKKDVGQEIAKLREQLTTAQYEATARTNKVEALLEERSKWTADIVSYDSQLKQAHADKDRKSTKISEFEHEIDTLKNQLELKKADVATKSSSISELQRDKDKLDNRITLLENQLKEKEADMKFKADELIEMYNEKVTRETVNATLQVKLEEAEKQLKTATATCENLTKESAVGMANFTNLTGLLTKEQTESQFNAKQLAEVRQESTNQQKEITRLQCELNQVKESSEKWKSCYNKLEREKKKNEGDMGAELKEKEKALQKLKEEYDRQTELSTQLNRELTSTKESLSNEQSKRTNAEQSVNFFQRELEQTRTSLTEEKQATKTRAESHTRELSNEKSQRAGVERSLQNLQGELSNEKSQRAGVERSLQNLQGELSNEKSQRAGVERSLQNLKGELSNEKSQRADVERSLQGLQGQLKRKESERLHAETTATQLQGKLDKIEKERREAEIERNKILNVSCLLLNEPGMAANFKTARDDFMRRLASQLKEQKKELLIFEIPPSGELSHGADNLKKPHVLVMPCLAVSRVSSSIDSLMSKPAAKAGHTLLFVVFHPRAPHDRTVAPTAQQIGSLPTSCEKLVDVVFNRSNGGIFDGGPNDAAVSEMAGYMDSRPVEQNSR